MSRAARRKFWDLIRVRLTLHGGPMILREITEATRAHHEAVTYAVRAMVKEGLMVELAEMRPTRSGSAKQFDIPNRGSQASHAEHWKAVLRRRWKEERISHVVDRWADWVRRGQPAVAYENADRMLFHAIESALNGMPTAQASAFLNVQGLAVWVPRRGDVEESYREAVSRVARRLDPVFAISALASVAANLKGESNGQEGQRQGQGRRQAALLRESTNG